MYHIDPPNCWVSYCWQVGCIKREKNDIQKPCIHKVAGSGINEMIFPTFGGNQVLTNSVQVHHRYANLFLCTPKNYKACAFMYTSLNIAFCQLSVLGFPRFFTTHRNSCFVLSNVFHIRDKKIPYATLHQITCDRSFI